MNEIKENDKDLQSFLQKVDDIGSIIKELSATDEKTQSDALKKADRYLGESRKEKINSGFSKTVISKIKDDTSPVEAPAEMSAEDFMKKCEEDATRRSEKRKENKEKSATWKEKGNTHFKNGNYVDAVQCYSEAVRLTPDEVTFYSNRAQAFIKLEKYDMALNDCEIGMQLDKRFVKLYVHQGKALTGLRKYDEAINAFKEVSKIDRKQEKIITQYINGVERERGLAKEEENVNHLLKKGDTSMQNIGELISKLRKGSPPELPQANEAILKLKTLVSDDNYRIAFRTGKGFSIFIEHPAINRLMKQYAFSKEDVNYVRNIISLLSETVIDNEENSGILCSMNHVMGSVMTCLKLNNGIAEKFEVIQLCFRISQFSGARKTLLQNPSMPLLLNHALSMLEKGGDIASVAMGMINNLALDKSFVPQFDKKLSADFIPGIIKMMELLSLSVPDTVSTKSFLPVMASSISTIANLFHNAEFCKKRAESDHGIWEVSHNLLMSYIDKLNDGNVLKIAAATLGMLMNLSTQKIIFEEEFSKKWTSLSCRLIGSSAPVIVERCSGILNHTLGYNETMLAEIIRKKLYVNFMEIIKGENAAAKRYIIKCLALCVNVDEGARESIYSSKVLPVLLNTIQSSADELTIGNTALIFAHIHSNKSISEKLVDCNLVKKLLTHATNDQLSKNVRHNCAIAIGKYCLADSRYLQQLRDLHGLEILHEVMKENKLV